MNYYEIIDGNIKIAKIELLQIIYFYRISQNREKKFKKRKNITFRTSQ